MAKVWWKFEQNRAVGTKVTEQNHKKWSRNDGITESRNDGQAENSIPPLRFAGGIKKF